MATRNDIKALEWISNHQEERYDWVSSCTYSVEEDYGIDLTLTTVNGLTAKEEVKTSRNHTIKDEKGEFNDYYSLSTYTGMYRNLYWGNLPNKDDEIRKLRSVDYYSINFYPTTEEQAEMGFNPRETPAEFKDKYVYVLNASSINRWNGNVEIMPYNCKAYQMFKEPNSCLIYIAEDGYLIWNPKQLREAFLGYVWMYCKHTNDFQNQDKSYELKAMFDMSKAKFIKTDVPKEIFN